MDNVRRRSLSTFDFNKIKEMVQKDGYELLFVFSCGYEKRSVYLYNKIKKMIEKDSVSYLCLSFSSYKNSGSRKSNDKLLAGDGLASIELEPKDWLGAWDAIITEINKKHDERMIVCIDYSSMPRNWYCGLGQKMVNDEMPANTVMLYTKGKYSEQEYPCVGYGQFHKFSGRPKITNTKEINVFGLGFDSTRTYGIWTYLDPESSAVVLAKTPRNKKHCDRVYKENPEIISASDKVNEIHIDQFDEALSELVDMVRKYSAHGDVALVPDGPKPLILAMSLVPLFLNTPGIYCWHVGHVKPEGYEPIDIDASREVFGFSS